MDHAVLVAQRDVLAWHAEPHVVLRRGDRRGARSGEYDLDARDVLLHELQRVEQRGTRDDRRAVLVVVKHRYRERVAQRLFDVEAVGRADVFEVDPTYGRLEQSTESDHILRVFRAHLQIEHVDVRERLEEDPLAFHHRLACERSDIAQAEHRGAVGDHGHEVPLGRVGVGLLRPGGDLPARFGDPRRVGEGQVALVLEGLGGRHLDLPRAALRVVIEGLLATDRHRGHKSFLVKELCYPARLAMSSTVT